MPRTPATRVHLWDLDKTYLVSHFESLRGLLRVPFEKGEDKVAVPGAVPLIKALRRSASRDRTHTQLYFLSASPPQIGTAIREKLALDGIEYDGITFKDQVRNLVRGRIGALMEQIGYKTQKLLESARALSPGSVQYLFGDDWESDPFIYSLYADIVAGRVSDKHASEALETAGVHREHRRAIAELLTGPRPDIRVGGIFVLRQRPLPAQAFEPFGKRLVWFDDYFQCALRLHAAGLVDVGGVVDVARDIGKAPAELAASFAIADAHRIVARSRVGLARRELVGTGLMAPVERGNPLRRTWASVRRRIGQPTLRLGRTLDTPDYVALAREWSYRGRKERARVEEREAELARDFEDLDTDESREDENGSRESPETKAAPEATNDE